MALSPEQTQLYEDLCVKLDQQQDEPQLIRFMGGVLGSLLRRKGDAQFLRAVQDAFAEGMAGRPLPQQMALAREVVGMVIAKRPEIALAWQRVSGEEPHPLARRAVDLSPEDDLPEISLDPEPPPPADSFEAFFAAAIEDVTNALTQRVALFKVPSQRFPSPNYVHEQPFFLHAPSFVGTARIFLAKTLMPTWREALADIHRRLPGRPADVAVFEARPELWALVTGRLGKMVEQAAAADAKLAAVRAGGITGVSFQTVEVPVTRKRTLSVLGVSFSMGETTETVKRRVPVQVSNRPSPDEMLARDLEIAWHDAAADAGIDLPAAADLGLLLDLLSFDAERLAQDLPGLLSLVGDPETATDAVLDGIEAASAGHPALIADSLAITLFAHGSQGAFGYEELVRLAARWPAAEHPFLAPEVARRPRDLAFQIRDALRRRLDRNNMGMTVVMLFEVWKVLLATAHKAALDQALTVFSAFPIAFAGDASESVFSDIGAAIAKGLSVPEPDTAGTVEAVMQLYSAIIPPK